MWSLCASETDTPTLNVVWMWRLMAPHPLRGYEKKSLALSLRPPRVLGKQLKCMVDSLL